MNLSLLKYFLYLRDVSHKIAVTSDWSKCLKQKPNRFLKPIIQNSWLDLINDFSISGKKNSLKEIHKYLLSHSDKEAFLGIGSIYGLINKKQICGSIFNIPITYEVNESNGKLEDVFFDFDNIVINHQLLLSFFEFADHNMFLDLLPIIEKIKQRLKKAYMDNPNNVLLGLDNLKNEIEDVVLNFFESKSLRITKETKITTLAEKQINLKYTPIISFEYLFILAFEVPSGISTWKYLNDFCSEIKENETLSSDVLQSILSSDDRLVENKIFDEEIFNLIPISLSNSQKESIKHALTDTVSYVQGPPGTGKSHTITALAMIALLLGKKTLIVSQKPTALQVIKAKLDDCFQELIKKEFVPYLYFDKANKKQLKKDLEKFISKNKNNNHNQIDAIHNELEKFHNKLSNAIEEKILLKLKIDEELNKQHDFSKLNLEYQSRTENIDREISYKQDLKVTNLKEENIKFINELLIIKNYFDINGNLKKILLNKLKKLNAIFNKKFNAQLSFIKLLKEGILINYIEKILELGLLLEELTNSHKNLLNKTQLSLLYKEKETIDKEINEVLNMYYYESVEYKILLNFYDYNQQRKRNTNDFENFTKMLHFQKPDIILEKMKSINYDNLLNVFNLWLSEIRYIGEILPNNKEMFDLIIIDEASQVNIAEIFPVLYRGKAVCIVGDEKQLGLNSVGLNFMLGTKEEQHIWDKYLGTELTYENAELRDILVTKSSILEMITSKISNKNYNKIMLDEHFRSMPQLAKFTNKRFYNNDLKIMTDTPERTFVNCFQAFKVDGKRDRKRNLSEAIKVIEIIKHIHNIEVFDDINISSYISDKSIGIVSVLREQVECIKEELLSKSSKLNLSEEKDYYLINGCRIKCGTPEELQGDEFDYVIFSATVDGDTRNHAHYNNENRLNVATSRAKYFTYFIYSDISNIPFFANYLRTFGISIEMKEDIDVLGWTYSEHNFDSKFEEYIAQVLKDIILKTKLFKLKLFNQVEFAKKRIDFVIYNEENKKYVAIEVDGQFHFKNSSSRIYSEEHNERIELLTRAGWNIINTPYYAWYIDGYIDEENNFVIEEKKRLEELILKYLS